MGAAFERRDGTAQAPMPFWARRDKAVWGGLARHLSFWILIEIVIAFVFHFMLTLQTRLLMPLRNCGILAMVVILHILTLSIIILLPGFFMLN